MLLHLVGHLASMLVGAIVGKKWDAIVAAALPYIKKYITDRFATK